MHRPPRRPRTRRPRAPRTAGPASLHRLRRRGSRRCAPWPSTEVLARPALRDAAAGRHVARQPPPRPGDERRRRDHGRALVIRRALLDAEVVREVRGAHEARAERGARGVVGAAPRAGLAGVTARDEEEARAVQRERAIALAVAAAALGDRAVAFERHARAGGALAAEDLVSVLGRAVRGTRAARTERTLRGERIGDG